MSMSVLTHSETTVLVLPSAGRDVHHSFIYPAPPFDESKTTNKIKMVSDPCVVDVEGLTLGITSTDILFHLGKEEISFPPRSGDRLRRLASHILHQVWSLKQNHFQLFGKQQLSFIYYLA